MATSNRWKLQYTYCLPDSMWRFVQRYCNECFTQVHIYRTIFWT